MNSLTIGEAMGKLPFLRDLPLENTAHNPLEIRLTEMDGQFLNRSLLEEESEAIGHLNTKKTWYVASGDKVHSVDVRRTPTRIYSPDYLRPGLDTPYDEFGSSETIREALSRQDLTEAQYVVFYERGATAWEGINCLLIALIKK